MLFELPDKIQIGGHTYEIVVVAAMPDNASVTHRLQKILVNLESAKSQRVKGLIHEFAHIINGVYCGGRLDEDDIAGIAEGFLQVLLQLVPDLEIKWEVKSG